MGSMGVPGLLGLTDVSGRNMAGSRGNLGERPRPKGWDRSSSDVEPEQEVSKIARGARLYSGG